MRGSEKQTSRWETGGRRERQVQFARREGGAACRPTAAPLCNTEPLTNAQTEVQILCWNSGALRVTAPVKRDYNFLLLLLRTGWSIKRMRALHHMYFESDHTYSKKK